MGDTPGLVMEVVCAVKPGYWAVWSERSFSEEKLSFLWCVLNATGPVPVMSQEPQDFPFFLLPLAKIFCLSSNLSVFS